MANNNHATLFINKVIQTEDFGNFAKFGITEESLVSVADREAYRFIADYHAKYGDMPSYATVAGGVQSFVYVPNITDRFEPLVEGINDRKMAVEFNRVFEQDFDRIKRESGGDTSEIISQLTESLSDIRMRYTNTRSVGKSAKDTEAYLAEYKKRQAGESHKVWKSFSPKLTEYFGGYTSANFYTVYAKSGRGKSVFAIREALEAAMQGATVLYWALEMDYYSVMTRLYSMLSAKLGKTKITVEGEKMEAGFGTRDLRQGTLSSEFETSFEEMLATINEHLPGEVIIKGIDDPSFVDRSITQLEADIRATNADIVYIDALYLMDYQRNDSKTAGGDASATSKKVRMMAGQLDVTIIGITQSEEGDEPSGDGIRELKVPERKAVKKSKSFLEDASTVIALDSDYKQGRAVVGIVKGRDGGEGNVVELTYVPDYGVVEELVIDESMFAF